LRPFPVLEQDSLVWVWLGDPAKAVMAGPPRTPEITHPARETADTGPMQGARQRAAADRNLLDIAHFYPLPGGNIGRNREQPHPGHARRGDARRQCLCRDDSLRLPQQRSKR